jgi:hypothetical protein
VYDLKFILDSFHVFKACYSCPTPRKNFSVEDDAFFVVKKHSAFDASRGALHVFAKTLLLDAILWQRIHSTPFQAYTI